MPVVKINLAEIFQYLSGKSRPVVEGEAVFNANHVLLCEVENVEKRRVFGLCLQSSALKSPPHEVKLELGSPNTSVTKWSCKCSCKAGQSGFCKHVVAVLLHVNRHEELNKWSCTDVKQVWGREKKNVESVYAAERAVDFWHFQKKHRYEFNTNEKVEKENLKLLLECKPSSATSVFHKNAASVEIQRLYSFRNIKANIEPMQFMLRSYTFFTLLVLFLAFLFSFQVLDLTIGFLISEKYPWMGYSPDGFIFKDGKPHALLEIKCPFLGKSYSHNDENFIKACDFLKFEDDQTPKMKEKHKYYGQVQLGMGIAGVKCTHLVIYSSFSDTFLEVLVGFNESFFRELISNTSEKYLKHMIHEYCKNKNSFC